MSHERASMRSPPRNTRARLDRQASADRAQTATPTSEPALVLRPYQIETVSGLRQCYASGSRAVLLQLATAAGKTIIFTAITYSAWSRGRRVLIVVHRRELVEQAAGKLSWAGVPHGLVAAGFPSSPEMMVQVASVQTAIRRLATLGDFDFIILDEAHHARAATWPPLTAYPRARILGVTATPARLDGKGLGSHCGGPFDAIHCGPPIADLIRDGYLSRARYFIPQQQVDLTGVRVRAGDYIATDLAQRVDKTLWEQEHFSRTERLQRHRAWVDEQARASEHVGESAS